MGRHLKSQWTKDVQRVVLHHVLEKMSLFCYLDSLKQVYYLKTLISIMTTKVLLPLLSYDNGLLVKKESDLSISMEQTTTLFISIHGKCH